MSSNILSIGAIGRSVRSPRRTASLRLIGPAEPQCPPLRLVGLRGAGVVQLHQPEVVLGRHSDADLQLLEADVSRFHCRFVCIDGQWELQDLGSLNGTQVNGTPIQCRLLQQNDVVRVADFLFQVDLGAPRELSLAAQEERERSQQVLETIAARLPERDEEYPPRRKSA